MNAFFAGFLTFALTFGGALIGIYLAKVLPPQHLDSESKDVVRIAMATVATLSALVIGLLIASAKESFDDRATELKHAAAQSLLLDRTLAAFGKETQTARTILRGIVQRPIDQLAKGDVSGFDSANFEQQPNIGEVQRTVLPLVPTDDNQRWLKTKALEISADIAATRSLLLEQSSSGIQWPFLVILMFWLGSMFLSFGLFAPRNATVLIAFFVSALSVGSSIFVILEMDQPYGGLIRLSDAPIRQVLDEMGKP